MSKADTVAGCLGSTQPAPQPSPSNSVSADAPRTCGTVNRAAPPAEPPAVIVVGATGRLVRLATVAVELGLTRGGCKQLLRKLGVQVRRISRHDYVHLFQLERALWRWYGLSDDLQVFEMAYLCYRDLERRGLERHLKRLGLKQIRNNLKERATLWENLRHLVKGERVVREGSAKLSRPRGRPMTPVNWVKRQCRELGVEPQLGPTLQADPAIRKAGAVVAEDLNPGDGAVIL